MIKEFTEKRYKKYIKKLTREKIEQKRLKILEKQTYEK